jgi:membrane-associated protease RseP (regulator of RpoE activity)
MNMSMKRLICGIGGLAATLAWGANPCNVKPTISTHVQVITATNVLPDLTEALGPEVGDALQQAQAALQALAADPFGAQSATSATETAAPGPRPWLGVSSDALSDDVRSLLPDGVVGGLIVRHVEVDSPAAKAGVQVNDILLKIDDQLLVNPEQLRQLVQLRKEGDQLALTALRKGKELTLQPTLVMKELADDEPGVQIIRLGDFGAGSIKMELPAEIQKMLESAGGGATVFSTSIVVRSSSSGGGFSSSGSGKGLPSGGGSSSAGISAKTVNGKTTITYKGEEVFSGPTSGRVSTKSMNINGDESAAAFDGDKVLWESKSGAADALRK